MIVICPYCKKHATLTTGDEAMPDRPDLSDRKFWICVPCDAMVGTRIIGEDPFGTMANRELRKQREAVHAALRPIWDGKNLPRNKAYAWLMNSLGLGRTSAHIGMFSLATCKRALRVIDTQLLAKVDNY